MIDDSVKNDRMEFTPRLISKNSQEVWKRASERMKMLNAQKKIIRSMIEIAKRHNLNTEQTVEYIMKTVSNLPALMVTNMVNKSIK